MGRVTNLPDGHRRVGPTARAGSLCEKQRKSTAFYPVHLRCFYWRSTQDSNLRCLVSTPAFQASTLDHSDNAPHRLYFTKKNKNVKLKLINYLQIIDKLSKITL